MRKAVEANIKRKQEFATTALKSIREIQSTGVETLSRIADCMNKRGEKTPRGEHGLQPPLNGFWIVRRNIYEIDLDRHERQNHWIHPRNFTLSH